MSVTGEDDFETAFQVVAEHIRQRYTDLETLPTTPAPGSISDAIASLPDVLPETGLGTARTTTYLMDKLLPGCLQGQSGPRYFGFVCGGTTPASQLADMLATSYDENVQVTLPQATAATAVEARALEMVLDLLNIPREAYQGRTITTGATASNVLGLGEAGGPT